MEFIDTVAGMVKIPGLGMNLFPGQSVSTYATGEIAARWYRNDEGEARCTYYPATGWLRVEYADDQAWELVDKYVHRVFSSSLPSLMTWRCQRVDYCVDLVVDDVAMWLGVLRELQVGSLARHPFPDGVVWKSKSARGRWVKWYDKSQDTPLLRFEVSNYRDAVKYMSEAWFGCERTVEEMTRPGRAWYVLARYFEELGLTSASVGERDRELAALRDAFGQRALAGASHALECIRKHGTESYKSLKLLSKSSYYRWLKEFRAQGFLVSVPQRATSGLKLPFPQNLEIVRARQERAGEKISWEKWAALLGVNPAAKPLKILEVSDGGLDRSTQRVPGSGAGTGLPAAYPGAAVAACAR